MSREPLSKDVIVEAALRLMAQGGLEALSMRKLGDALGVKAMSLYNHIRNKAELYNALHAKLLSRLEVPEPNTEWREAARLVARSFRDLLRDNPNSIALFAARSAIAPGSLRVLDRCLGILLAAGFQPAEAIRLFQTIFAYTLGHCQFYYGPRQEDSYSDPESYAKYPNLVHLPPMADYDPDAEFETTLGLLLP